MSDKVQMQILERFGRMCIEAGKLMLKRGEEVCPCLMVIGPRGGAVYAMVGKLDADERNLFIRGMVEQHDADAFVHVGDVFVRDLKGNLIAEQLSAVIQTKDGKAYNISCRYTRDPFEFGKVEVREGGFWRPVWEETAH